MADITNVFKATVKTVKTRNKAQGAATGPDKNALGLSKPKKTEFATRAKDVVNNIAKLNDFLLKHRKDYINAASHMGVEKSSMTDAERDQIDMDAQTFMRTCSEAIRTFRLEMEEEKMGEQTREHRFAVFDLIEKYLKGVCRIYGEQKAIRVKRAVDRKRIARLEPERKHHQVANKRTDETLPSVSEDQSQGSSTSWQDKVSQDKKTELLSPVEEPPIVFEEDEELSPEEAQMFEIENQQLYDEMNSFMNEIKQVEGKVVEISRLQEIFTDKILDQDKAIDHIADTVVGATENIKDANDEIREAMKNNAGLRVWILFFLIVCSFSLLFLDWYNP